MPSNVTIPFSPANGQVSLIISSGYATQGRYTISATDGATTLNIGSGSLTDTVPDMFALPIPASELDNWLVSITGSYSPAAGHTQVSVDYKFTQRGRELRTVQVRGNNGPLATEHACSFETN